MSKPKATHPWRAKGTLRAQRPAFREKRNPRAAILPLAEIHRRAQALLAEVRATAQGAPCEWCGGSGRISEVEGIEEPCNVTCGDCGGSGQREVEQ